MVPLKRLPPSRGMKLMRTPPVAACASTPETSNGEFRRAGRVRDGAAAPPAGNHRAERDAVDHHALVGGAAAVGFEASATSCTTEPPTSWPVKAPFLHARDEHADGEGVRELGIALTIS